MFATGKRPSTPRTDGGVYNTTKSLKEKGKSKIVNKISRKSILTLLKYNLIKIIDSIEFEICSYRMKI
ncbi:hypothetical protein AKJ49_00225 [candidate division MSBL1 archaeon SCGC-AAA382A03]|uniref:Uncharacterized protein n=1 Tax=candidate division MSBL1 archaeon SCGC-AAA382A03 TaxID=1698278 RepID=A0A133VH16_9EURY|nr:hypothetical protein AKJ49_00225 [candidate division MSBL1 archaeon SCGC-AAA382A03]